MLATPSAPGCKALGVHPWWAAGLYGGLEAAPPTFEEASSHSALRAYMAALGEALAAYPALGVGECGLDLAPRALANNPLHLQRAVLIAQLELAWTLGRTVSLHCVRASEELTALLAAFVAEARQRDAAAQRAGGGFRGLLMHSWAGSSAAADAVLAVFTPLRIPVVFSFNGSVVPAVDEIWAGSGGSSRGVFTARPASKSSLACLLHLPSSCLAFETDAPDQGFLPAGDDGGEGEVAGSGCCERTVAGDGMSRVEGGTGGGLALTAPSQPPSFLSWLGETVLPALPPAPAAACTESGSGDCKCALEGPHGPAKAAAVLVAAWAWRRVAPHGKTKKAAAMAKGVNGEGGEDPLPWLPQPLQAAGWGCEFLPHPPSKRHGGFPPPPPSWEADLTAFAAAVDANLETLFPSGAD